MSERFPAQISIGGTVTPAQADKICEFIINEGLGFEWGEHLECVAHIDLRQNAEENTCIILRDDCAQYGVFEEFETYLRKEGIAFDRHSDAKYEYNGEIVRFRSEDIDSTFYASQDGKILIPYAVVNEIREYVCEANDPSPRKLDIILQMLTEILGPEIPDLEPFVIGD